MISLESVGIPEKALRTRDRFLGDVSYGELVTARNPYRQKSFRQFASRGTSGVNVIYEEPESLENSPE